MFFFERPSSTNGLCSYGDIGKMGVANAVPNLGAILSRCWKVLSSRWQLLSCAQMASMGGLPTLAANANCQVPYPYSHRSDRNIKVQRVQKLENL